LRGPDRLIVTPGVTLADFRGSAVPRETIAAYLAAEYRFWGDRPLVLRIGQASGDLAAVYRDRGAASGAVITAWNPRGVLRAPSDNHAAQAALIARLDALGLAHDPGHGADPAGAWSPEDSRLVLGVDRGAAAALGRDFGQNAIVWADHDAAPNLLMLR
jgi:hypothetical protein